MRYEYYCTGCSASFEMDLSIDQRDEPCKGLCGLCDSEVRRAVGNGGGFRLLGRGWESDSYATHFGDTDEFKNGVGK